MTRHVCTIYVLRLEPWLHINPSADFNVANRRDVVQIPGQLIVLQIINIALYTVCIGVLEFKGAI